MKLSDWAKKQGVSYQTAWRWWKADKLPVPAKQMSTGTIIVEDTENSIKEKTVIYARVSNHPRKKELNYQVKRCEDFCVANGWTVSKSYKEIASGMNDNRKQLWSMLNSNPTRIVVENKDRLTRFGFNYLNNLLKKQGCQIIVINTANTDEEDLMKDLVSIITSFCSRIYGLRRAANKTKKIKGILKSND